MKIKYFFFGLLFAIFTIALVIYSLPNIEMSSGENSETSLDKDYVSDINFNNIKQISSENLLSTISNDSSSQLITVWASWCSPCIKEIPFLQSYAKRKGIKLIYLNVDNTSEGQMNRVLRTMRSLNIDSTYSIGGKNSNLIDVMNKKNANQYILDLGSQDYKGGIPYNLYFNRGILKSSFYGVDFESLFDNWISSEVSIE